MENLFSGVDELVSTVDRIFVSVNHLHVNLASAIQEDVISSFAYFIVFLSGIIILQKYMNHTGWEGFGSIQRENFLRCNFWLWADSIALICVFFMFADSLYLLSHHLSLLATPI